MSTYRIDSDIHTETNFAGVGIVSNDFKAGVIIAADEQERIALDRLVELGIASVETGSKKTSTKASDKSVADTPSEE